MQLLQELFGHFIYFGERGNNQGWLNTLTYDRPVFDKDGGPTKEAKALLVKLKNDTPNKTGPHGAGNDGSAAAKSQPNEPSAPGL